MTLKPWMIIAIACIVVVAVLGYMHQDLVKEWCDKACNGCCTLLGHKESGLPE